MGINSESDLSANLQIGPTKAAAMQAQQMAAKGGKGSKKR